MCVCFFSLFYTNFIFNIYGKNVNEILTSREMLQFGVIVFHMYQNMTDTDFFLVVEEHARSFFY